MHSDNHRTRVGAERRQKMRLRLLESALQVFAEKGPDGAVIDDMIVAAGISRGTFYNYFRTNEELLIALAETLSDELAQLVDALVQGIDDPLTRVALALRAYLHTARSYPLFAAFIDRAAWPRIATQGLTLQQLVRDLKRAQELGLISVPSLQLAQDLVLGPAMSAIHSLCAGTPPQSYPEDLTCLVLKALGVAAQDAERLATLPLATPQLPADSLLRRAGNGAASTV